MTKFRTLMIICLCTTFIGFSQTKEEREHRILCGQFPKNAVKTVKEDLEGVKQLKYYQEIEKTTTTFTAKFKKNKLFYRMDFNAKGDVQNIGYRIKEVDIPNEIYAVIDSTLTENFEKPKTRRMFQQYAKSDYTVSEEMIKTAFQNLLLPNIEYKFLITGKKKGYRQYYEVIFNATGEIKQMKESVAANYDHVLY